jgi:hypothetical protein
VILLYTAEMDVRLRVHAGSVEGTVLLQEVPTRFDHRGRIVIVAVPHLTVLDGRSRRLAVFRHVRPEAVEQLRKAPAGPALNEAAENYSSYRLPHGQWVAGAHGRVHFAGLGRRVVYAFRPDS